MEDELYSPLLIQAKVCKWKPLETYYQEGMVPLKGHQQIIWTMEEKMAEDLMFCKKKKISGSKIEATQGLVGSSTKVVRRKAHDVLIISPGLIWVQGTFPYVWFIPTRTIYSLLDFIHS